MDPNTAWDNINEWLSQKRTAEMTWEELSPLLDTVTGLSDWLQAGGFMPNGVGYLKRPTLVNFLTAMQCHISECLKRFETV